MGQTTTNVVNGSTDDQIKSVLAMCNEEGQELAARYAWTALQAEGTFTTLATEDQGALSTIASGLNYIVNDTIWNRSLRRPVFGPKNQQSWQQQKAFAINGPWSSYRLKAGHLWMYPVPTAGQSCYFEYISKNWCQKSDGSVNYSEWNADTDIPLLDDQLIVLGTIWRWKALKGFEYSEDFNTYERRVTDAMSRDGGKDWLNTSNTKYDIFPGVVVPAGSWNL
jgi:hypothetical protein